MFRRHDEPAPMRRRTDPSVPEVSDLPDMTDTIRAVDQLIGQAQIVKERLLHALLPFEETEGDQK